MSLLLVSPVLSNPAPTIQLFVGLGFRVTLSTGVIGVGWGVVIPILAIVASVPAMSPMLWWWRPMWVAWVPRGSRKILIRRGVTWSVRGSLGSPRSTWRVHSWALRPEKRSKG